MGLRRTHVGIVATGGVRASHSDRCMQTLGRRSDADPLPTCAEGRAYELGLEAVLGWPPSAGLAERREIGVTHAC